MGNLACKKLSVRIVFGGNLTGVQTCALPISALSSLAT